MEYAFEPARRWSEMLITLLSDTRVILGDASNLGELLREGSLNHLQEIWIDYESACNDLSALRTVLVRSA